MQLQSHGDERGALISLEDQKNIPFLIKRVYYILSTKQGVRRGFHAHRNVRQMLMAVHGQCRLLLDDGKERVELLLDNPAQGLLIESVVWREMYDFSSDCVLLVLANEHYCESDYIREYQEFLEIING